MRFQPYLLVARRYIPFALVPALIITLLVYAQGRRQMPTYDAVVTLYIQQPASSQTIPSVDINGSELLAPTYKQMIADPVVMRAVDRAMARSYRGYRIEDHGLTTDQSNSAVPTQLVHLHVTDSDSARAVVAANMVARIFIARISNLESSLLQPDERRLQAQIVAVGRTIKDTIQQISTYRGGAAGLDGLRTTLGAEQVVYQSLQSSYTQFQLAHDTATQAVRLYSPATVSTASLTPQPVREALLAGLVALLCGIGAIRLYDYLDSSLRTPEEFEEALGAPVLGAVPSFGVGRLGTTLIAAKEPGSLVAEAYRRIQANIQLLHMDGPAHVIVITSALSGEGKSTLAGNLAYVAVEGGQGVTLANADGHAVGVPSVVALQSASQDAPNRGRRARPYPAERPDLALATLSSPSAAGIDAATAGRLRVILDHLQQQSGLVIVDAPPLLQSADASVLARLADGVILVVDPRKSRRRELQRARTVIEANGGRLLGVVVNRLPIRDAPAYYAYGYPYRYKPRASDDDGIVGSDNTPSVLLDRVADAEPSVKQAP